jgi:hypothetical protein
MQGDLSDPVQERLLAESAFHPLKLLVNPLDVVGDIAKAAVNTVK